MNVGHSLLVFVLLIGFTPGITQWLIPCASRLPVALGECLSKLKNRLGDDESVQLDPSPTNCCYFAEFLRCLDVETNEKCYDEIGAFIGKLSQGFINRRSMGFVKSLNKKCENYSHKSPTCLLVYQESSDGGNRPSDGGNRSSDGENRSSDNGNRSSDNGNRSSDNGNRSSDNGNRSPGFHSHWLLLLFTVIQGFAFVFDHLF